MRSNSILFFVLSLLVSNVGYSAQTTVAIPCVDNSGAVKNATGEVCKAALAKCSDLKKSLVDNMNNALQWKIYGYYQGLDIDINKVGDDGKLVGDPLPTSICSVVGHNIINNSEYKRKDWLKHLKDGTNGEITTQQTPYGSASCGTPPRFRAGDGIHLTVAIRHEGVAGSSWKSYVLGAYPWIMRKKAQEIRNQLKDDLSNLGEVLHSDAMSADVKQVLVDMQKYTDELMKQSAPVCNQTTPLDCSNALQLTDTVQKICTLKQAQLALNGMALPNMLSYEALTRSKKMYDELFSNILSSGHPKMFDLIKECSGNEDIGNKIKQIYSLLSGAVIEQFSEANKKYSCVASCLDSGYQYYTSLIDSKDIWINDAKNMDRRKCTKIARYNLDRGMPETGDLSVYFEPVKYVVKVWDSVAGLFRSEDRMSTESQIQNMKKINNPTVNAGFAGLIEMIIRKDICGQKNKSSGDDCGQAAIPATKPSRGIK